MGCKNVSPMNICMCKLIKSPWIGCLTPMDTDSMLVKRMSLWKAPKNPLLRSQWLLKKQQEGVSRARRAPPSEEQWNWLLAADRFCEEGPATYFKSIHSGQHSLQHFVKVS